MLRQIEKKAFLFYASTFDILRELSDERQRKVALALIEYGLDDCVYFPDYSDSLSVLEPIEHMIFHNAIYEISIQKRRYYNKNLIRGAIEAIQSEFVNGCRMSKDTYTKIIDILEEKYKYVTNHDELNVPEELSIILPEDVNSKFKRRYGAKSWRDYMKEMFEKRLKMESRCLPDDIKKEILDKLMSDYLDKGTVFERYEELLEKYTKGIWEGGDNNDA